MFAFARLAVILFVVLTVIYICLSFYSRAQRREKLERQWEEEGHTGDRAVFLRDGLRAYDGSLRRKLILGVYVIPVCVIGFIIYAVNFM